MNIEELEEYSDAWNNHDIDTIMKYMTQDCVFETGSGAEKYGTRYEGFDTVRDRFIAVWTNIPDARFENGSCFVSGNKGCSEWTFVGTTKDGARIEIDGCDLFDFEGGKIKRKATYMKHRS